MGIRVGSKPTAITICAPSGEHRHPFGLYHFTQLSNDLSQGWDGNVKYEDDCYWRAF